MASQGMLTLRCASDTTISVSNKKGTGGDILSLVEHAKTNCQNWDTHWEAVCFVFAELTGTVGQKLRVGNVRRLRAEHAE